MFEKKKNVLNILLFPVSGFRWTLQIKIPTDLSMYICLHRKPVLYLQPEKKEIIQSKNKIICLAFIKENENLALYYTKLIVYGNIIIVMEIREKG